MIKNTVKKKNTVYKNTVFHNITVQVILWNIIAF